MCRQGRYAELAVSDHGIGIPYEDQPKLFQPFMRGTAASHHAQGTGLEPYIVHQIVEQHGGTIALESAPGRLSTYPGVCLATLGPGATNLLTGVADANLDRAPLVAISGQAGLERTYKESHQYIDVVDMFRPVTKWATRVERADAIPEIVRKAFRIARLEKPGTTHIELPEDIADEEIIGTPMPVRRRAYPRARDEPFSRQPHSWEQPNGR